jgi:hypothetical protein
MSTFDSASLVMIPSGYKDQKIYSVKPTDGTGDLTFSRASSATRVASNGLIEKVRTNLVLQSETFDNASWASDNGGGTGSVTRTANYATAPNGTMTADRVQLTKGTVYINIVQNVSTTAGQKYTASVYLKSLSGTPSVAFLYDSVPFSATLTSDWVRVSVTYTASGTATAPLLGLFGGNSATADILAWGYQIEVSDFGATDYIATTTAAVSVGPVSGLPRLDYLGSTCPRLLLEPQRTNLITYSEQIDNAAWSKEDISSVTANAIVSPDGSTNADLVIPNTTSIDHTIYQIATAAVSQTFSVFAKAGGYNFIFLGANNGVASDGVFFNLTNGTISQNTSVFTAKIESYGNGWYRCSISAASWPLIYAIICTSANGTSFVHAGNGTSGVYVWGAQLEAGAYATSYIPTLGATVTRVADAASKTGISSLIGQTEGTLFVEFKYNGAALNSVFERILALTDGTTDNRILILKNGSTGNLYFYVETGAVLTINATSIAGSAIGNNTNKLAIAYKSADYAIYLNGISIFTSSQSPVPATSQLFVGSSEDGNPNQLGGTINQALLFKTRLTNAQLAELTA